MSHFAHSLRPARCFTLEEANRLLDVSGRYAEDFREHVIFAMAFGLGLRAHEIRALNIGDVFTESGTVRRRIKLRVFKGHRREGAAPQEIHVPDSLQRKLAKLRVLKVRSREDLSPEAPLCSTRKKGRISDRHMRRLLKGWLEVAGLDPTLRFHELRHTALTDFYGRTRDVVMAQRFARHADVRTTIGYLHSSDSAMAEALQGQLC